MGPGFGRNAAGLDGLVKIAALLSAIGILTILGGIGWGLYELATRVF